MFIYTLKQRSRNAQKPRLLYKPLNNSHQQYIKLFRKSHNQRQSWYNKKKQARRFY